MGAVLDARAYFAADDIIRSDARSDVDAHAPSDKDGDADALEGLYSNRQLFSVRQLRCLAQLPVVLRQLRIVHDHTTGAGRVVRDELLDRVVLRTHYDRRRSLRGDLRAARRLGVAEYEHDVVLRF